MFSCGVMLGCWSPTWILSRVCWSLWGEVASAPNCVANVSLAHEGRRRATPAPQAAVGGILTIARGEPTCRPETGRDS